MFHALLLSWPVCVWEDRAVRPFSLDPALFPRLLAAHAACRLPLPPQRFGSAVWRRQSRPVWTRRSLASRVGAQSGSMAQAQLELRPHVGAHPELRVEAAPDDQDPSGSPREEDPRSALRKLQRKMYKMAWARKKYAENKEYREKKLAYFRKKYAEDEEYREKRKMSVQGYKKDNKAKIAAYKRKKYAEDEEYRVRTKMIARRYRENNKAKIAMVDGGKNGQGQGEEGNVPGVPGEGPSPEGPSRHLAFSEGEDGEDRARGRDGAGRGPGEGALRADADCAGELAQARR